jgi:hypothetical protein
VRLGVAVLVAAALAGADASVAGPPLGRHLLQTRGLWTYFEHRGAQQGYNSGELLKVIGQASVQTDVTEQLKRMRALGVNELLYEMRSGDGPWPVDSTYPACERSTDLGPQWPLPAADQLAGLRTLFALASKYGMRVTLILNTTHMEQDATGNSQWLGAIAGAVKDSPALDLIIVGGDKHRIDAKPPYDGAPDSCGFESEAPLWLGPDSVQGRYVQWALGYLHSLGLPPQKLSAEAIVGDYRHEVQQPAGPDAQDGHLWRPLEVLRTIFDRIGFAPEQRTYALSYYTHAKCAYADTPCTDESAQGWTYDTLAATKARVEPQARLILAEFGGAAGGYQHATETIGADLQSLGLEGGFYWKWADETNDPQWTDPASVVKQRGQAFVYNPQERELADLYGFHLTSVPNGSFETGTAPWTTKGTATASTAALDENAPWRGTSYLHLSATGFATLSAPPIRVSPSTAYTTTANLRFAQPNVRVTFTYLTCRSRPSSKGKPAVFSFTGAQAAWQTFPFAYTTPKDACYMRISVALSSAGTLDIDDVR